MSNQTNELKNMMASFFQMNTTSSSSSGPLPSNTIANLRGDLKAITTQSGVAYDRPPIPPPFSSLPKVVEREPEVTKNTVQPSTKHIQPPVVQTRVDEPVVAPKLKPTIPYPSRTNKQKLREKDDNLASNFLKTPVNENCSAVILKTLPEKLGDPGKFLIPCNFPKLVDCLALADLGASIKLMPLSIWEKLSLPELTHTQMILELADRSKTRPAGIAEDVFVKVGKFHFPADFVVVDYIVDPRVPLILGRPFLRTARALIDVYGEELTLRVDDEAITFKVGQTSRYSYTNSEWVNRIDVIDVSYPILSISFPSLTPFEGGDFILEELKHVLQMIQFHRELMMPRLRYTYGALLLLEKLLNNYPSSPLPSKELHFEEIKMIKSSIDDPLELELKEITRHILNNAFYRREPKKTRHNAKELKDDEKTPLLKSPWVSPVHCVPKKGGMTVIENDNNELIPTRLVTGWRVCIDYQKLNDATRKDHFPVTFPSVQKRERPRGNEYYCFLDGFSGYFQIPIDPKDQDKTTFTCPYGTFAYRRMHFGLCNALGTFQMCMMAIFHDMIEETMEVFMEDFSVFGDSFSSCLSHLDKKAKKEQDTI
ncbi:reverse transcriptase domain-containing protein [Tanacetum coccineum]